MQTLVSGSINISIAQENLPSSGSPSDSLFCTWEAGSNTDTLSQLRINDLQNPQPWEAGIDTNALPQLNRQKTFQHSSMQLSASNLAETHDQITCTLYRLWPSVMLQSQLMADANQGDFFLAIFHVGASAGKHYQHRDLISMLN